MHNRQQVGRGAPVEVVAAAVRRDRVAPDAADEHVVAHPAADRAVDEDVAAATTVDVVGTAAPEDLVAVRRPRERSPLSEPRRARKGWDLTVAPVPLRVAEPQRPQADVVRPRRGLGPGGHPPGVDRHQVVAALGRGPVGAIAARAHGGATEQALGEAEADGELEVVARRPHRRRDERAVELDAHRLLDGELVGRSPEGGGASVPTADQDLGRVTTPKWHCFEASHPGRTARPARIRGAGPAGRGR